VSRTVCNGLLLLVAVIWGTAFVAQQLGMRDVGPLTFTGVRFLMGALFVLPLALREASRLRSRGITLDRKDLLAWGGLGVLLFFGATFQQIGVAGTSVSNAGFLTALYVPLVPLLGWALDRFRPHPSIWPAIACTLVGTYLLSGGRLDAFNAGDWWVIASTLFWAGHVLWVGRVAARTGAPILVACAQFVVCGVLACLAAVVLEDISLAGLRSGLPTLLYGGLVSVGVAFTVKEVAQRYARPTDAAILLSSEILFAALAAAVMLDERLTALQWAGGGVIFLSILAVQVLPLFGVGAGGGVNARPVRETI